MKIEGQAAIVSGGSSGLGAETARELGRRGAKVAVLDKRRRREGHGPVRALIFATTRSGRSGVQ